VDARVFVQSREHFGVHPSNASGRIQQSFSVGIFTDSGKYLAYGSFNSFVVHGRLNSVASG
jgi:hypothetical protein